jgi:raffinose/stachyose/melibiose transport system permease protein
LIKSKTRKHHALPGEPRLSPFLYVAPTLIFFALFVAVPIVSTINISFYDWNGLTPGTWVGAENYAEVLGDEDLRTTFLNSLFFIIFFCFIPVTMGLFIASILGRHRLPGMPFFRVIFFLPQVVSITVSGIAWRWMYSSDGVVNQILGQLGLQEFQRAWLGDFDWALTAIGVVGTWIMMGLTTVLFLAGIQKIDPALYDAARVDGASPIQEFFAVTLPGLRAEIAVALSLTIIAALKSFDLVFATTGGGPGNSTQVPAIAIYRLAFREGEVGVAAAIAIVLAIIIGTVVILINRFSRSPE